MKHTGLGFPQEINDPVYLYKSPCYARYQQKEQKRDRMKYDLAIYVKPDTAYY